MPKRASSRPPLEKKPVCPPPTRPCPPAEDVEKPKRVRSLTPGITTSGNTEGDKRARDMERETASRARSYHSSLDVTPHPSGARWGMIKTSLATESSDEESSLDPNLDRSGVPFQEDQAEEEQVRMSVTSSGNDTLVTDVDPETKTDAEHIQVASEATNALAVAEINMATLKQA